MHGDRHQRERENALERFKKGEATILVSTDVIGRGIDIKNVKTVINFDLPQKVTEYNNRIGRTARIGHSGRAISFYDPNIDAPIARRLCKSKSHADIYDSKTYSVLGYAGQHIPEFLKDDAFYKFDWDLQQQVLQKNEPVVSFDPNEIW